MSDCKIDPDTLLCIACMVPASGPQVRRNCRPGLGDRVHAALSAVGITPERVAAVLGVDDCGCDERRKLWNQAGHALGIGSPPAPPEEGGAEGRMNLTP